MEFMRRALALAYEALDAGEVPVGAVVVKEGKIIAEARNEREMSGDPTAHAEVLALRRAAKALGTRRLSGCTLYVTLEPCPMCAGSIVMAGVDRVVFGAYDPEKGCAGSIYQLPEDPAFGRVIPCDGGLLSEPCKAVLNAFFDNKRS